MSIAPDYSDDEQEPAPAPTRLTLDAYAPRSLPNWDVFDSVVWAASDTVTRCVEDKR